MSAAGGPGGDRRCLGARRRLAGRVLPDDSDARARRFHFELGQVVAHRQLDHLVDGESRRIPERAELGEPRGYA